MAGESGTAIFALNNANLDIYNSNYINNSATNGGLITISESSISLRTSTIDQFSGSAIEGDTSSFELTDVTI